MGRPLRRAGGGLVAKKRLPCGHFDCSGKHGPSKGSGGSPKRRTEEELARSRASSALRIRYGIDIDDYEALLAHQGGVCAGCMKPPPKSGRRLHVDHDHKTKQVRGILCWQCNNSILRRGITSTVLRRLADYLDDPPFLTWKSGGSVTTVTVTSRKQGGPLCPSSE